MTHVDPSDQLTKCYTLATCGTDQLFKIWRIYFTGHVKGEEKIKSRLIPTTLNEHICGGTAIYPTETMNAECVLATQAHGSSVTCVKFNATGTLLFTCGLDKAVKIWDLQGNCLRTMGEHQRYVNCISINSDCSVVASGSNDKSIILWDLTGALTLDSHITGMRNILFKFATNQGDVSMDFICPITHEIMKEPVIAEGKKFFLVIFLCNKPGSPFKSLMNKVSFGGVHTLSIITKILFFTFQTVSTMNVVPLKIGLI